MITFGQLLTTLLASGNKICILGGKTIMLPYNTHFAYFPCAYLKIIISFIIYSKNQIIPRHDFYLNKKMCKYNIESFVNQQK